MANKTNKVFITFLIPYLCVLLIPLVVSAFAYQRSLSVIKEDTILSNRSLLEQTVAVTDSRMKEISSVSRQVTGNPGVVQFAMVTNPFEGHNIYSVYYLKKSLPDYSISNRFIFNYYIWYEQSDLAVNSEIAYMGREFFERVVHPEHQSYDEWRQFIFGSYYNNACFPAIQMTVQGETGDFVPCLQSLDYPGNSHGVLLILVKKESFQQLLGQFTASDEGWAYITDPDGKQIVASDSAPSDMSPLGSLTENASGFETLNVQGRSMFVSYLKSDFNGWTYVAVQPAKLVFSRANGIRDLVAALFSATLVIGLAAAAVFAYRYSSPVRSIVKMIGERLGNVEVIPGNALSAIGSAMSDLFETRDTLSRKIGEQLPFLRAAFCEKLLKGGFRTTESMTAMSEHVGLPLPGGYYRVGLFLWGSQEDNTPDPAKETLEARDLLRSAMQEAMRRHVGETDMIHLLGEEELAVIFHDDDAEYEAQKRRIEDTFSRIRRELEPFDAMVSCYVGSRVAGAMSVPQSYDEAKYLMNSFIWRTGAGELLWFSEYRGRNRSYHYPAESQMQLVHLVMAGDTGAADALLEQLGRENFESRHLTVPMLQLFVAEVRGTAVKLADQSDYEPVEAPSVHGTGEPSVYKSEIAWSSVDSVSTRDAIRWLENEFLAVRTQICEISEWLKVKKSGWQKDLSEQIRHHLNLHYSDPGLSLAALAEQFHFSEAYLSVLIKTYLGMTFSEYLEDLRMRQARQQLESSELPVQEIGRLVGYSLPNTFLRAFKRLNGVTPTHYRKLRR